MAEKMRYSLDVLMGDMRVEIKAGRRRMGRELEWTFSLSLSLSLIEDPHKRREKQRGGVVWSGFFIPFLRGMNRKSEGFLHSMVYILHFHGFCDPVIPAFYHPIQIDDCERTT